MGARDRARFHQSPLSGTVSALAPMFLFVALPVFWIFRLYDSTDCSQLQVRRRLKPRLRAFRHETHLRGLRRMLSIAGGSPRRRTWWRPQAPLGAAFSRQPGLDRSIEPAACQNRNRRDNLDTIVLELTY